MAYADGVNNGFQCFRRVVSTSEESGHPERDLSGDNAPIAEVLDSPGSVQVQLWP